MPRYLPLLIALGLAWTAPAQALRCGSRLVVEGDPAPRVAEVCGEPSFVDVHTVHAAPYGPPLVDREEWYYNFGPSRLVVVLTLRGGRVVDERTDGYGYSGEPRGRCSPYAIRPMQSKFHVLWHCGRPDARQAYTAWRPLNPRSHSNRFQPVQHEEWIYRFEPRHRDRAVTFENGRVTDIDRLD